MNREDLSSHKLKIKLPLLPLIISKRDSTKMPALTILTAWTNKKWSTVINIKNLLRKHKITSVISTKFSVMESWIMTTRASRMKFDWKSKIISKCFWVMLKKWIFQDQFQGRNKEDKISKKQFKILKLLKFKIILRFLISSKIDSIQRNYGK